jgi:hypothetical protein
VHALPAADREESRIYGMSDAELFWRVEPVDRENSEYFEEAAMSGFGTFLTWREV